MSRHFQLTPLVEEDVRTIVLSVAEHFGRARAERARDWPALRRWVSWVGEGALRVLSRLSQRAKSPSRRQHGRLEAGVLHFTALLANLVDDLLRIGRVDVADHDAGAFGRQRQPVPPRQLPCASVPQARLG